MRSMLVAAVLALILVAEQPLQAQQAAAPQAGGYSANAGRFGLAVVDISYVFKNYSWFNAQIEALKKEMEAADGELKTDRDQLVSLEQQRDMHRPGTPDFKKADENLARLKADFSIKQGTIRRDFLEREAKIYYTTYLQVSDAVKSFAQAHGIGMVLRFNGDQIDPTQREDVMRAIMQPIVFQHNIDITPDVLAILTRGAAPGAAAPTARAPSAATK